MIQIGIPRALFFYQYYPLWYTFFTALDAEIVLSPSTNREIMSAGLSSMVSETCLPVKTYAGHVAWLRDAGVDWVFIPAIRSFAGSDFNCSKFLGLPDLMKANIKACPPILDMDVDASKPERTLDRALQMVGRRLCRDRRKVDAALAAAFSTHHRYQVMMRDGLTPMQAMIRLGYLQEEEGSSQSHPPLTRPSEGGAGRGGIVTDARLRGKSSPLTIALVGHPYCIYDTYLNHNILKRLTRLGVHILTCEMAPAEGLMEGIRRLSGEWYWTYEGEVVGAAGHYFIDPRVDGVIAVAAFGCGPDSTMLAVIQRAARLESRAYMSLIIDEHSGEAGIVTRLEAFVDMLARRKMSHITSQSSKIKDRS